MAVKPPDKNPSAGATSVKGRANSRNIEKRLGGHEYHVTAIAAAIAVFNKLSVLLSEVRRLESTRQRTFGERTRRATGHDARKRSAVSQPQRDRRGGDHKSRRKSRHRADDADGAWRARRCGAK